MKLPFFSRRSALPLGVDIGTESVSIVAPAFDSGAFAVHEAQTRGVERGSVGLEASIAETIRRLLDTLQTRERRCIVAAPSQEIATRVFRVPPHMGPREAYRAAAIEAATMVDWPASERLVALDAIPGRGSDMLLSVARRATVERILGIARAGGLAPVAVDVPACAWRRAVAGGDAFLDCSGDRTELVIFAEPIGLSQLFPPRLVDERLVSQVRAAFIDARRDGVADVQRIAVLGGALRVESLLPLLSGDGYVATPLSIDGIAAPSWAFAYGLASWTIAGPDSAAA